MYLCSLPSKNGHAGRQVRSSVYIYVVSFVQCTVDGRESSGNRSETPFLCWNPSLFLSLVVPFESSDTMVSPRRSVTRYLSPESNLITVPYQVVGPTSLTFLLFTWKTTYCLYCTYSSLFSFSRSLFCFTPVLFE